MSNLEFNLHAMRALDRNPRDAREGPHPADAPEDTRRRWTDLDQEQKINAAVDYMRRYANKHGSLAASELWEEALTQTKTTKGMVEFIGRVIVRENDSELVW